MMELINYAGNTEVISQKLLIRLQDLISIMERDETPMG